MSIRMNTSEQNNVDCPVCRNNMAFYFSAACDYRKPKQVQSYDVYQCGACYQLDTYYTHNNPSQNKETHSFGDKVRMHLAWRFDQGVTLTPQEALSRIQSTQPTICEIGCGKGHKLTQFAGRGFTVFGVEPDPSARNLAKETHTNIFEGTAEDLPQEITSQRFDVVLMSHVLEHCLDINRAIKNAHGILKDDGVLIVETPNNACVAFKAYQAAWPFSDIPRHLNFFTPDTLKNTLKNNDFDVQETKYHGFYRQVCNTWLDEEADIWQALAQHSADYAKRPNFKLRAWKLLLKSMLKTNAKKYDSVRLIAAKQR
jgi:2-polyprenyl-3-methyl-5-hydroxy-6-metoxy-1,4-benzoquinol methylase